MKNSANILSSFLYQLGVKYTSRYANKLYTEHPHRHNLLGVSDLLNTYNIPNKAFKLNEKEDILMLTPPFLAQIHTDFFIITNINAEKVCCWLNNKEIFFTRQDFIKYSSGNILLAKPNTNSIEPHYKQHHQREKLQRAFQHTTIISAYIMYALLVILSFIHKSTNVSILLILNLIGVFVSFLLLQKYWHIGNEHVDKICSFFKQSDCNRILESDAASLGKITSWSEIGFSYFCTNIYLLFLHSELISWIAIINICSLPYSIFSIWYQGVRVVHLYINK